MHAPDADAHGHGPAGQPGEALPAPRRRDPSGELERRVGRGAGDEDREDHEEGGIGLVQGHGATSDKPQLARRTIWGSPRLGYCPPESQPRARVTGIDRIRTARESSRCGPVDSALASAEIWRSPSAPPGSPPQRGNVARTCTAPPAASASGSLRGHGHWDPGSRRRRSPARSLRRIRPAPGCGCLEWPAGPPSRGRGGSGR